MKFLFSFAALFCFSLSLPAQHYWQQEVNYILNVQLDDVKHGLSGNAEIEYINHSPDQLNFIYFHLWPNAYKNTKTALAKQMLVNNSRKFYFAKPENRGAINGLNFTVNGKPAKLEFEQADIAKLILNEPLPAGGKIKIATPFQVKIPGAFSRLGHVGQSYQISQWYPKPAVYDRKGWHPMPYLDQGEFYSEFGKFDVKITLPENYTVGATGELQTLSEQTRMDSLAAVGAAKTSFGKDNAFPESSKKSKTLHYVQDRVHDFAWFADKRFNVLKSEVELPVSKRKVTTWLMFLNSNADGWLKRKNDINDAIYYYSKYVGEYPYSVCTAVDGALGENAGGMEYPMVTVTIPSAIIHEVGHNWFYGILASNERDHVWLDEGVNSYVESRIAEQDDPKAGQMSEILKSGMAKRFGLEDLNATPINALLYQISSSRGLDQPIQYPAADYTVLNYGGIVYMKSAVVLKYLAAYLGQERFDAAVHAYFEKWKFKHPYPEDMQAVFEESTGEKLDWFFKQLVQTTKPADVEIKKAVKKENATEVIVKNESGFALPVPVAALDASGKMLETQWAKPFEGETTLTFSTTMAHRFLIDPEYVMPELNRRDNQLKTSGLLRKQERITPQFLLGVEQNNKNQLYFSPVIGANTSDKFMLGAAFYNSSLVAKKLNYLLMPMYSFNQKEVNGIGNVYYNLVPRNFGFISQTKIGVNAQRFEVYEKLEPSVTINLRRRTSASPAQSLKFMSTFIQQEEFVPVFENPYGELVPGDETLNRILLHPYEKYFVQTVQYNFSKVNALQEFGFESRYQFLADEESNKGNSLVKAAATYKRYYKQNKAWRARLFAGSGSDGSAVIGLSGSPDYLKETVFLDRAAISENYRALIDQTDNTDGAFKNYLPVYSNTWLTTLNLQAEIPYLPLSVYADFGRVADLNKTFYGTGLMLSLGEFFQLYLPLAGSNFENNTPENFKDFRQNIRFSLNLNRLNPFKLLEESL